MTSTPDQTPTTIPAITSIELVELRQYTLYPQQRDVLIALFESEFIDTQEACGLRVMGQFHDLDNNDKFVWFRGFPTASDRANALASFYMGPTWRQHRDAANATMLDSDDVLLLSPIDGPLTWPRPSASDGQAGDFTATIYSFPDPITDADRDAVRHVSRRLEAAGADEILFLETANVKNDFPALPVREKEHVIVSVLRFPPPSSGGQESETDSHVTVPDMRELRLGLRNTPQILRLSPTLKSGIR